MKYILNKQSVILLKSDEVNGFKTIAFNPVTDEVYAIRPKEYSVLKLIHDKQEINTVSEVDQTIFNDLLKKGIILEIND